jgi:hypothetical protein
MMGFEVALNGRALCTAGVGDAGVLTVILSAVFRQGEAGREASELTLEVGGFTAGEHRQWPGAAELSAGDEVVIRVLETAAPDPPARVARDDPAVAEARQRAYYERLRAKYEGA